MKIKYENVPVMNVDGTPQFSDASGNSDEYYSWENLIIPENPVKMTLNFDEEHIIGISVLKKSETQLLADAVITDEGVIEKIKAGGSFYPAIGAVLKKDGKLDIFTIGASETPNADERIPPFENGVFHE